MLLRCNWWRHAVAEAVLVAGACWVFLGGGSGGGGGGTPPQAGVLEGRPVEPSAALPGSKPEAPKSPAPAAPMPVQEKRETLRAPEPPAETKAQAPPPAAAEPAAGPAPTAVEPAPRRLTEMDDRAVGQAVEEYRRWAAQGALELELNAAEVSAEELATLVAFYTLQGASDYRLRVDPAGGWRKQDEEAPIPDSKLWCAVPPGKRPPALQRVAERLLGKGFAGEARLFLSDRAELRIYRCLAGALKSLPAAARPHFLVKLRAGRPGGEVQIDVVPAGTGR